MLTCSTVEEARTAKISSSFNYMRQEQIRRIDEFKVIGALDKDGWATC